MSESVEWARTAAKELRAKSAADEKTAATLKMFQARAIVARHLEFLRLQGPKSAFYEAAQVISNDRNMNYPVGMNAFARVLDDWADFAESGLGAPALFEVRARVEAATDLMEQVQRLLDDNKMHPAAPVMLCGAALEELLRSMAHQAGLALPPKPSLNTYATQLRKEELLTAQEVKDITSWAGLRNSAAHGDFDKLSREQAVLMAMGVNLFMQQRGGQS